MGTESATDWIPLARAMEGNEAEMARGFLESQGISVQLRPAQRGTFNFQNSSIGGALLHQADLFVPRDTAAMASEILGAIRPTNPEMDYVELDENLVQVYDETDELQEYRLSPGGACPVCGEEGLRYKRNEEIVLIQKIALFLLGGAVALNLLEVLPFFIASYTVIVVLILLLACVFLYIDNSKRGKSETWHCPHCNNKWHK